MKMLYIEWLQGESVVNCENKEFECMALCMDYAKLCCSKYNAEKAFIYESDDPQDRIVVYP